MSFIPQYRASEHGSALVYILIAIALLALLTVSFMDPSSQQTQSQNTFKAASEINAQVDFLRSAVQECVLAYPGGDITIDNDPSGTDPGARKNYPIAPDSGHFLTATIGPTAGRLAKDIRCPGNPGDDDDHEVIFGGTTGKFFPPAPDLFEDWQWYNGTDGVFFWTETTKTDAFVQTSMDKLEENFAACEADQIDATASAEDLDSDSTVACSSGATCFRVWMIIDSVSGSPVFPDEGGCP